MYSVHSPAQACGRSDTVRPVLDILAVLLGDIVALLPGHLLVDGLLLLSAVLDWLLGELL